MKIACLFLRRCLASQELKGHRQAAETLLVSSMSATPTDGETK